MVRDPIPFPFFAKLLVAATFFINFGRFLVFTFLTVYLTHTLDFEPWQTGTILTIALLVNQILPLISGVVGDRIGYSTMLVLGCISSSVGFFCVYSFASFQEMIGAAILIGGGAALYEPSIKSIFGNLQDESRKKAFTYFNQALNAGAVLGALAGGLSVQYSASLPMLFGTILFTVVSIVLLFLIRKFPKGKHSSSFRDSYRNVLKHKEFRLFSIAMIFFWIMYAQLTVSLPLEMYRVSESSELVSGVIISNGLFAFVLMFFLRRLFNKGKSNQLVKYGMLIMGSGLILIAFNSSVFWVIFCVLVFTIGETLGLPGADLAIAEYSSYEDVGAFYGVFGISFAIGGTLGNYLGTWLMGQYGGSYLPWLIYGLMGAVGFGLMKTLEKKVKCNQSYVKIIDIKKEDLT
ncbi:MDR family MFS transporter [Pseudalkalibacillus decolorationis]|uniref:MDR family MFS transporter n=1 Tax=Pseudalkalibacillus decolorationis TaxID=163879 RepID=UPI0035576AA1